MLKLLLCLSAAASSAVDLINMPVNTWISLPNSRMDAVDPCPSRNCSYSGVEGVSAVMDDWNSGVFDTKRNRLVLWGGGHNGYYGNELYAFAVDTQTWSRLTDPSTQITFNQDPMANGMPVSRHTYGGLAYIAHADRFFGLGGSTANNGDASTNIVWTFDFDALGWTNRGSCGHSVGHGSTCAYDPISKKLFWYEGNNSDYNAWGLHSYDYDNNRWIKLDDTRPNDRGTAAIDTKRGLLFIVGGGHVYVYDIKNSDYTEQDWTTAGGGTLVSSSAPGLDYDPVADRIVGWNGGAVYALNPDTKAWTAYNPAGAPTRNMNGTYGRWRYVLSVNAFISANQTSSNVYFYKMTPGLPTAAFSGNSKIADNLELTVSPNPVTRGTALRVTANTGALLPKAAIYDLRGRLVGYSAGKTAELMSGVYMMRITALGREISKRFVVQ